MKILVLGSRIPWPLRDGGAIATYNMLKAMSALGIDVTYFSYNTQKHFVSQKEIDTHISFCKVICQPLNTNTNPLDAFLNLFSNESYNISRFKNADAYGNLELLLKNEAFDLIHFEGLYSTPFLSIVRNLVAVPIVLRQHNVEYQIWERLAVESRRFRQMPQWP